MEQLQTNGLLIYGKIFAHFLIYLEALPESSYMTLQLLHSEFPYIWRKFDFFVIVGIGGVQRQNHIFEKEIISKTFWKMECYEKMVNKIHEEWKGLEVDEISPSC